MIPSALSLFLFAWLMACTPPATTDAGAPPVIASTPAAQVTAPPARPLQRWMEAELMYRILNQDFRGLVRSLDALATIAPAEYPHWAEVATRASQAASEHNLEAVRRGCAACHQQYRAQFRSAHIPYDVDRLIERSRL